MLILNLGCGTRTSPHPDVVNVDWTLNIRIKKSRLLRMAVSPILDARRRSRLDQMAGHLLAHDLSKGIPFDSGSVDAVYHSHVLEHLDRSIARSFLEETRRVLKPGGLCRIVVPDFEFLCRAYVRHLDECQSDPRQRASHEDFVEDVLEQSVRREAAGTSGRKGMARLIDRIVLGDARRRGETHQWMYDAVTLPHILEGLGYGQIAIQTWSSSAIPDWHEIGLDRNSEGGEYKPHSLYVEARK
jgi:SAM-dependent methyltransferase